VNIVCSKLYFLSRLEKEPIENPLTRILVRGYGICQIHHRGMLLSRVMGIVRLRFIFDLLMISIVAVIGITIGL